MSQLRFCYHTKMKSIISLNELMLVAEKDPVTDYDATWRISFKRSVYNQMSAYVCCALCTEVPASYHELESYSTTGDDEDGWPHLATEHNILVPYTLFSTQQGKGHARQLLSSLIEWATEQSYIHKLVTISPQTQQARSFHLHCGAKVFRENEFTVNYEYNIL